MAQIWQFTAQDPYESMQAGMDQARKNRLGDIDVAEKARAYETSKVVNALYSKLIDPVTGQIDRNRLYGEIAKSGYGGAVPVMQRSQAELEEKQAKAIQDRASAAKALTDADAQEVKNGKERLAPVNSQNAWDLWRNSEIARSPNPDLVAATIPAMYSPTNKEALMQTASQMLERHFVSQGLGGTERVLSMPKYGTGRAEVVPGSVGVVTASPNRPQTNVVTKLEGAEAAGKGNLNIETYKGIQSTANAARDLAPKLTAIRATLDKGFETGQFAPIKAEAAAFLSAIGVKDTVDPETGKKIGPFQYATDAQKFKAIAQERVLERQLEQKGVQTTSDAARMEQTFARLGNTTDANRFLVDVADAQGKMAIKKQDFWDDWWDKNGTYEGVDQAWKKGEGSKSIFDMPNMKKYLESTGGKITVTAPNGKVYEFADQAAADNFKKAAGIK